VDQIISPVKDPIPRCHIKLMLSKIQTCHKYSNSRQAHRQTESQTHWAQPDPADHRNALPWSRAGGGGVWGWKNNFYSGLPQMFQHWGCCTARHRRVLGWQTAMALISSAEVKIIVL